MSNECSYPLQDCKGIYCDKLTCKLGLWMRKCERENAGATIGIKHTLPPSQRAAVERVRDDNIASYKVDMAKADLPGVNREFCLGTAIQSQIVARALTAILAAAPEPEPKLVRDLEMLISQFDVWGQVPLFHLRKALAPYRRQPCPTCGGTEVIKQKRTSDDCRGKGDGCNGTGWIDGIERACPYCNPGGEFRRLQWKEVPCPDCGKPPAATANPCLNCGKPVGDMIYTLCHECYVKRYRKPAAEADNARLTALVGELVDILDGLGGDHNFPDTPHGQTLIRARADVPQERGETPKPDYPVVHLNKHSFDCMRSGNCGNPECPVCGTDAPQGRTDSEQLEYCAQCMVLGTLLESCGYIICPKCHKGLLGSQHDTLDKGSIYICMNCGKRVTWPIRHSCDNCRHSVVKGMNGNE